MSSDSANGTLDADNDGVAVGKAATIARDTVPEASESADHVVQSGPQLSEFVLRVVDRIAATRNKIRDCKTDIETQKALYKMTTSNGGAGAADAGLNLSDLSSSRAEAKLEEAGTEFIQTMLQFDGLTQVMHASQISEVIETALQDKPDSQIQLDDEEVAYVKGLLVEQAEVSKQVVVLEEERLQKSLEHMEAMVELEREMSFLGELYPSVATTADDDGSGRIERERKAKRSKGNGTGAGGDALLEEKRATLSDEEGKLSQMKYMLGQLIMAADKDKMKPEVMTNCLDMMNKCGQTIQQIQDGARK